MLPATKAKLDKLINNKVHRHDCKKEQHRLNKALRELKNSKKFCLFFILNLSFGILGFLVLHSFKTSVNESLGKRAKLLLASDISVSSRKPLDEIKEKQITSYIAPFVEKRAYVNSIYSMAQSQSKDKKSRLVQLKMISDNFPLYGEVSLKDYGKVDNNKKETFKLKTWILSMV